MKIEVDTTGVHNEKSAMLDAGSPMGTLMWTPLQYACACGNVNLVEEYLQQNNTVNATGMTKYGYTPLHIATKFEHVDIVKCLLANGAFVDAVDSLNGFTALHIAVVLNNATLVELLHRAGATQIPSKLGNVPFGLVDTQHENLAALVRKLANEMKIYQHTHGWLKSIGLEEYASNFHGAGFDDLTFLLENGLSSTDLVTLGVVKPGHLLKLQKLYKLEEYIEELKAIEERNGALSETSEVDSNEGTDTEAESDEESEDESNNDSDSE